MSIDELGHRRRRPVVARRGALGSLGADGAGGVDDVFGLAHQIERVEHGVGVDAEVDEAGHLVDADRRDALDQLDGVVGRAEQPARLEVAGRCHVEQL